VADPTFSPPSGTVVPVSAHLSCPTPDAVIRYTLDGAVPTVTSPVFTTNLFFTELTMVRARAFKTGMTDSEAVYAYYVEPAVRTDMGYYRTVTNDVGNLPLVVITNGVIVTNSSAPPAACFTIEERLPVQIVPVDIDSGGQWLPELGVVRWGPYTNLPLVVVSYRISGRPGAYTVGGVGWADGRWKFEPPDSTATILGGPDASVPSAPLQVATPVFASEALQAESASSGGGVTNDTANAGFNGSGYANFPTAGGFLQFDSVSGGAGGEDQFCGDVGHGCCSFCAFLLRASSLWASRDLRRFFSAGDMPSGSVSSLRAQSRHQMPGWLSVAPGCHSLRLMR
jgi:hypothetical protein